MAITDRVLVISTHYKRSGFFETTVRRLLNDGFFVAVLDTGNGSFGGRFSVSVMRHKNLFTFSTNPTSYDGSMIEWKTKFLPMFQPPPDYIVYIDNDLYLSGTEELKQYLTEFVSKDIDFASHLVREDVRRRYSFAPGEQIALVDNMVIHPGEIPTPEPHFESSYMIIKHSLWEQLSTEDVGHMRKFITSISNHNAKIGAHYADYLWNYSAWGREWFHVGDIMNRYGQLDGSQPFRHTGSEYDLFRVGYFAAHEKYYPGSSILSAPQVKDRLVELYNLVGGKKEALACWDRISQNTCLQNWKV